MSVIQKSISIPRRQARRPFWDAVFYVIAAVLRWINRHHNDYDIRELMDELTPAESAAEKAEEQANHEKNMREALAWSDIWHSK